MGQRLACGKIRDMTAQILDGKATLATIKDELKARIAALAERGVVVGLGTIQVGEDPGSRWYVNAKHKDCAEVGIASIRHDLQTGTSQAEVEAIVDQLNSDPACTGFLVQQPTGLDEFAILSRVDPQKDVDGLHPFNLGCLVLGEAANVRMRVEQCPCSVSERFALPHFTPVGQ